MQRDKTFLIRVPCKHIGKAFDFITNECRGWVGAEASVPFDASPGPLPPPQVTPRQVTPGQPRKGPSIKGNGQVRRWHQYHSIKYRRSDKPYDMSKHTFRAKLLNACPAKPTKRGVLLQMGKDIITAEGGSPDSASPQISSLIKEGYLVQAE